MLKLKFYKFYAKQESFFKRRALNFLSQDIYEEMNFVLEKPCGDLLRPMVL